MGMVCFPTWIVDLYGKLVGKYISPMGPMGGFPPLPFDPYGFFGRQIPRDAGNFHVFFLCHVKNGSTRPLLLQGDRFLDARRYSH